MNIERTLNREDASLLVRLADQLANGTDAEVEVADRISEMIAQAVILAEGEQSESHVALGSVVSFKVAGEEQSATIVAPQDADARAARFSVLTPVGLALIGLPAGGESEVILPSGSVQPVRVLSTQPGLLPAA